MRKYLVFLGMTAIVGALVLGPWLKDAAAATSQKFCIQGNSTGKGWSYSLDSGDASVTVNTGGIPGGSGPAALAQAWVQSINLAGVGGGFSATYDGVVNGQAYFTVEGPKDFRLSVGGCTVTGNPTGCKFNPLVLHLRDVG